MVRWRQIGLEVSSPSYSSTRRWNPAVNALTMGTNSSGTSAIRPPTRMKLVIILTPEIHSRMSRIWSRSRQVYMKRVVAPRSRAWVPSQITWLAIRESSAMITRRYCPRGGISRSRSFSTVRAKPRLFIGGAR